MRILQVSNLVSHHQLPLARQLACAVGENNFRFASVGLPDPERARLGWNCETPESWVLKPAESDFDRAQFEHWWNKADIVLCGERILDSMADRLKREQICFYMSERWWKPPLGLARLLHPSFLRMAFDFSKMAKSPFFHYLPIGPYAEADMGKLVNFGERSWRWGYFTELPDELSETKVENDKKIKILWAGRMLRLKRVDTLIRAVAEAERLGGIGIFELTLIGNGPERASLDRMAKKLLPNLNFRFLDPIPAKQVHTVMADHDVYVLPSNSYEGWGAVINEAMSSGCTVVASSSTGAASAMIQHGINGLLFSPGDWKSLARHLLSLADSIDLRTELSRNALSDLKEFWSPQVASDRFVNVCNALLSKSNSPNYSFGPMSRSWKPK